MLSGPLLCAWCFHTTGPGQRRRRTCPPPPSARSLLRSPHAAAAPFRARGDVAVVASPYMLSDGCIDTPAVICVRFHSSFDPEQQLGDTRCWFRPPSLAAPWRLSSTRIIWPSLPSSRCVCVVTVFHFASFLSCCAPFVVSDDGALASELGFELVGFVYLMRRWICGFSVVLLLQICYQFAFFVVAATCKFDKVTDFAGKGSCCVL